jgi:tetratricopeptide (TPR) repeat protein
MFDSTKGSDSMRPVRAVVVAALLALGASAQSPDSIWDDPVFKRQFIASYGFNAEIEPRVSAEEIKVLEEVRPLMGSDLAKAQKALAAKLNPDSSAVLDFTLGGIQFQREDLAAAQVSYERAVAKFPSFRRAWRNLGLIHIRKSEFEPAISAFTRMIELGGGDAYSYGLLGFAHASKQDYQPAEAAYRNALLLQPENTEWRLGLTRCVFKQGKFEDAAALLDALIARFPDKADFWLLQAHTYLGMKQSLRAAQNLEALEQLGKSTVDSLHTLGDIYVAESLPDLALAAYGRAVDLTPEQPIARPIRSAEVLAGRGAVSQARALTAHIQRAWNARIETSDKRKLLKLDARLAMAEGQDSAEAAAKLEEAVALEPLDGEALMLLGQHYSRASDPDRAILFYERAAALESFEASAKLRQAQVLVGMGRYSDAVPLLRRAQEVAPREDVARYLEQVERIAKAKR